jgi:SAM-dependent MidA family methyltransferase
VPRAPKGISGLIIANEWLDNVPCDVVELGPDGPRLVEVAADGTERLGREPNDSQQAWLECWWPTWRGGEPGERAEIGLMRDAAWADTVAALDEGVAVAIDYAHAVDTRPPYGSLTGYADGRQVPPVPDGSCDLTAHVALDACAAAAQHVADWTWRLDQRSGPAPAGGQRRAPRAGHWPPPTRSATCARSPGLGRRRADRPRRPRRIRLAGPGVAVPIPASLED